MLVEISLPKLAAAWLLLVALPSVLLGLAPLIGSAWFGTFSRSLSTAYGGLLPLALILAVVALGWFGGRTVFRAAEQAFWALNSMAVQPGYALCREAIRHVAELVLSRWLNDAQRARLRAASAAGAGLILCAPRMLVASLVGPYTRWTAEFADLLSPLTLVVPALANAAVILFGYCAAASFVWGMADASMDQPRDLVEIRRQRPASSAPGAWCICPTCMSSARHTAFGWKAAASGRAATSGSKRLLERLEAIDAQSAARSHSDHGDITDAGRSSEWAEFFTAILRHPNLVARMLLLPGNHDINVVDRTNPARLDFPTSPGRRLREMRTCRASRRCRRSACMS